MRRYQQVSPIREDITETTKHKTSFHPEIKRQESDMFIRTRAGDRLDSLAHEFYQDVSLWWVIATANNIGKGTFAVMPGTKLRIPTDIATITEAYINFNQSRR